MRVARGCRMSEVEIRLEGPNDAVHLLARASDIRLPTEPTAEPSHESAPRHGRVLVLTDVTELTRAVQMKADLAANASHELRTPVSAIRASVETLKSIDLTEEGEAARQFVDVIDRHSGRLEAMIKDLLDLSRLESAPARFEPETIATCELFEELRTSFARSLADKQLQWRSEVRPGCEEVAASPDLLRMILHNLVDNAIRFTDPGGSVTVTAGSGEDAVSFEVADTGCGIPLAEQQRVFERFYQVERARSGPDRGTGLGLSIVRHAAAAMNAEINLQSEPGQGTRVTINVPQR